jgi:hypothetical protein
MKIYVVTDDKGEIVATVHNPAGSKSDVTASKPEALPGQKVHQIDLPKDLEEIRDAEQIHRRLKEIMKS